MVTRREVNTLLATATLAPASLVRALAATTEQSRLAEKPLHFIYESNSPALGFSGDLPKADFNRLHVIKGDISATWFHELHPLWREKGIFTAGLTRESEFFILKTLARDYGYTVTQEYPLGDTCLVYWSIMPC